MSTPVLHLLAGPNGAGKSTLAERVLIPVLGLEHFLAERRSFVTETVFSHASKVDLVRAAVTQGYLVHLHVLLVPVELSVARVADRVRRGGHAVPEEKIRQRHARLWELVAAAARDADRVTFYDNSSASRPFREVARLDRGRLVGSASWPDWTAPALAAIGG